MQGQSGSTAIWVAVILGLMAIALAAAEVGLPLVGIQLSSLLGYAFLALAIVSFVGALVALFWFWVGKLWARTRRWWTWFRIRVKERWPFALARTVKQLRADNEKLEADKAAFETKSRELRDKVEGLIFERCIELSDELFKFLEEEKEQDPDETMRKYNERFKDKVDLLRVSLIQNGGWNPRADARKKLEYPETPDDLLSVASYIRNIGVGLEGPLYP